MGAGIYLNEWERVSTRVPPNPSYPTYLMQMTKDSPQASCINQRAQDSGECTAMSLLDFLESRDETVIATSDRER